MSGAGGQVAPGRVADRPVARGPVARGHAAAAQPPRPGSPAFVGALPEGVLPAEGGLEELDGTPIRPQGGATTGATRPVTAWWRGAAAAATLTARRPSLWTFALVAFLARGGILLLVSPIVVLPTLVGISNVVGPASVTPAGPAPRLVAMAVAALAVAAVLAVAGTVVAALAETAFQRASVAPGPGGRRPPSPFDAPLDPAGLGRGARRIVGVRLVLLVPVVVAVVVAAPAWIEVSYRELTVPSNVAVPLVLRVLGGTPAASTVVIVAWLACEVVGGFAGRRAVLLDASAVRALASGAVDPLRAPVGALLMTAAALAVSVAVLVPVVAMLGGAWDLARRPLVDEGLTPAAAGGTLVLVAAWAAGLLVAGMAASWRGCLVTAEVLRHLPAAPGRAVAATAGEGSGGTAGDGAPGPAPESPAGAPGPA